MSSATDEELQFLDTQRIHNLILYLEKLHHHGKATSDHTTLLLNCYAKLKDIKKLEEFIMAPGDLKFDLDTAITMCRQGGYYQQAAYLAKKHGETELVVDILIEDSKSYDEALDYIWHQDPAIVRFRFLHPSQSRLILTFLGISVYAEVRQGPHRALPQRRYKALCGLLHQQLSAAADGGAAG
jgi:hypothetical protein